MPTWKERMAAELWKEEKHVRGGSGWWASDVYFMVATYWPSNITHQGRTTCSDVANQSFFSSYLTPFFLIKIGAASLHCKSNILVLSVPFGVQSGLLVIKSHLESGWKYWQTFGDENVGLTHFEYLWNRSCKHLKNLYINLQWLRKPMKQFTKLKQEFILKYCYSYSFDVPPFKRNYWTALVSQCNFWAT